jgi:diguanylate cyclase (GGDEF)-like protein
LYNLISGINLLFFSLLALSATAIGKISFLLFLPVFFLFIILFILFNKLRLRLVCNFRNELESLQEKINLLGQEISEKNKIFDTLPAKNDKITSLFSISNDLFELYKPEEVLNYLISASRELFPSADNILLFVLNNNSLQLSLSHKKDECVIKEKAGDIIEKWLLRHNQSLLVEDIFKDFRFDYNKVSAFRERKMRSFIASPISVGDSILGSIRIENKIPLCFSMDDSRYLRDICDLGAVVLERATLFTKAEDLAIKDSLTSLYLKDYFFKRAKEELKRAKYKKSHLGMLMIDIDDFKTINDTYGHIVGDIVLKQISKVLIDVVPEAEGIIARFGGEEFVVALIESSQEKLIKIGEAIISSLQKDKINFRRKNINFTVSIGAALYPEDALDEVELIGKADLRLYKAKREGKNRLCYIG